ncbi:MAG TPA: sulfotransferase domain-containing protein [Vitreimonas sp.]|uniref:sulfotransferase domain-containing protein n=1 Tax=Vitreimonas sp. TaxID=3069702 RepID=UPI002D4E012F|nr:sulfotransferase domain-containing protein [Vitreimonas sp.]HYD86417.1 sulfotransferase domain-containing protein [Vitreimonas sp.]
MMLARAPQRAIKDRVRDSKHWDRYTPRPGDVVVATAPKVGTTWTQRIVSMLIFQSAAPAPIMTTHPWVDCRYQIPIDAMIAMLEAQTHRRALKSHLPFDALPIYDDVKYIHTARDGLDACFSFHNHFLNFTPRAIEGIARVAEADGEADVTPPPTPENPRDFFLSWIANETPPGTPTVDAVFDIERSYWSERQRENLLLVHFNDLKADLLGEMKRISTFLDIDTPDALWPELVEAATFDKMKSDGPSLLPGIEIAVKGGHQTFLDKGVNGRWKGVLTPEDIATYRSYAAQELPPGLNDWLENGRKGGDPKLSAD